ncbi:MAG: hypothetical protein FJ272_16140 [Planctomycetes bacterium]|nr:hypothetical protein [Planctomycetota bacterium]
MIKLLFLDYRQFERVDGFQRQLEPPRKHGAPLLASDQEPWERNLLQFYGSVLRRPDGIFQMWYSAGGFSQMKIGYAESEDGIAWRRPALGVMEWQGRKTNIVMDGCPIGATVIYDEREPRETWRYKMLCAPEPVTRISAFRSADGIHWTPAAENPVLGVHPDGPMGLLRQRDGRYAAYHRPGLGDRRVARSESWDFAHWSEPKVVVEPDQDDPTNVQFYGMGAILYGAYEIGTLWTYRTVASDMSWTKFFGGVMWPEFVHSRGGYAWHRTAQGVPWIPLSDEGFDRRQIRMASQPVLLPDEIRFYYAGCWKGHAYDGKAEQGEALWAISFAACKPDRFVSVTATSEGRILTRPFWTENPCFFVNAEVAPGGCIRAEITDVEAKPIPGFELENSLPIVGDSCYHRLGWKGAPEPSSLANREIRIRLEAKAAKLYSVFAGSEQEGRRYWDFDLPDCLPMKRVRKC